MCKQNRMYKIAKQHDDRKATIRKNKYEEEEDDDDDDDDDEIEKCNLT